MHDQTKTRQVNLSVAGSKSANTLLRRLLPTVIAATLALGVASGVASAAGYGGGDEESPVCDAIGCLNGNRFCGVWSGTYKLSMYVPFNTLMPWFGDYFFTPVDLSGNCYESPMY